MKSNLESHCIHLGHWRQTDTEKNRMLHNPAADFTSSDLRDLGRRGKGNDFYRKLHLKQDFSCTSLGMTQFITNIIASKLDPAAAADE